MGVGIMGTFIVQLQKFNLFSMIHSSCLYQHIYTFHWARMRGTDKSTNRWPSKCCSSTHLRRRQFSLFLLFLSSWQWLPAGHDFLSENTMILTGRKTEPCDMFGLLNICKEKNKGRKLCPRKQKWKGKTAAKKKKKVVLASCGKNSRVCVCVH